jgi:hypothetical protein
MKRDEIHENCDLFLFSLLFFVNLAEKYLLVQKSDRKYRKGVKRQKKNFTRPGSKEGQSSIKSKQTNNKSLLSPLNSE